MPKANNSGVPLENLKYQGGFNLETIDCPLCGGQSFKRLLLEHQIPIVQCVHCCLVFANPRPDRRGLMHFYENYFPSESAPLWQKQMAEIFYREGLQAIRAFVASKTIQLGDPPTILDIGCGMGFFLDLMRQEGWETWGVEPSAEAVLHGRKKLHLKIHEGVLEEFQTGHLYDVVTLWYVLEHVPNPLEVLQKAFSLLKKGGLLVLRVPNQSASIDVWLDRFKLGHFFLMNPPRHLFDYSPDTMRGLLKKAGFEVLSIKNGIPRQTGTALELLRRHLWYCFFEMIYHITGGKVIRGSSMTAYARKL